MSTFQHTDTREIILKETTEEMLAELGIGGAPKLDPDSAAVPVPAAFSLRSEMTPVEDQGRLGTCTSFCVTALLEHLVRKDLSEACLTHEAETQFGDCKEGLALAHGMARAREPGVVLEREWPYDNRQICWKTPPNVAGKPRFKFSGVGVLYHVPRPRLLAEAREGEADVIPPSTKTQGIKQQLVARRRPIALSVPVFWKAGWQRGPSINMPTRFDLDEFAPDPTASPKDDGWHCIAIVGFDDKLGRFVFKNSWNSWWGDQGYGTIPYQYIDRLSDIAMIGW